MKIALLLIGIAAIGLIATLKKAKPTQGKTEGKVRAKRALTDREQAMYFRLIEALPEYVVLAQVSFQALLTTDRNDRATRNTFDRKIADFVVCTKAFEVTAVIELDDGSHKGREKEDEKRDALLKSAGYRVIRYKQIPDKEIAKSDINAVMQLKERATEKTSQLTGKVEVTR